MPDTATRPLPSGGQAVEPVAVKDVTVRVEMADGKIYEEHPASVTSASGRSWEGPARAAQLRATGLLPPLETAGKVIIEWPRSQGNGVPGWAVAVYDAGTGEMIPTVTDMTIIHAHAEGRVWAELTMFATEDGEPILSGMPVMREGEAVAATFPFRVEGMRVRDE